MYKKLSKAAAANVTTTNAASTDPPSTPARPQKRDIRPSLLLSKPRVVETTASLPSFNPFSPVKNKAKQEKQRDSYKGQRQESIEITSSNPFRTPSRGKSSAIESRDPSPDALPAILPFLPVASGSDHIQPPAETAVSRARKRLRGEPVSPSPNKEKRRRVGSQISLPFAKLGISAAPDNDGEDDEDEGAVEANSSFVDDSPVKPPTGGKSFKLLFEEALPKNDLAAKRKGSLSRSKMIPASVGLFGDRNDKSTSVGTPMKETTDHDFGTKVKPGTKSDRRGNGYAGKGASQTRSISGKGDRLFEAQLDTAESSKCATKWNRHLSEPEIHKSTKRPLSDMESDLDNDRSNPQIAISALILLPPSPPPADSSRGSSSNYKGKGKVIVGSRKKAKVLEEIDGDEEDSADEPQVKLVSRNGFNRTQSTEDDGDFDFDPILGSKAHRGSRDLPISAGDADAAPHEIGKFEVDLPDKLRRVLAISPSKAWDSREERVVRGLLSGRRVTHYDGAIGGEIWHVGEEDDEIRCDTGGEDDWEGEPVPWEVGEL